MLPELFEKRSGAQLLLRLEKPLRCDLLVAHSEADFAGEVILLRFLVAIQGTLPVAHLVVVKAGGEPVARLLRFSRFPLCAEVPDLGAEQAARQKGHAIEKAELLVEGDHHPEEHE